MRVHGRLFDGQTTAMIPASIGVIGESLELIEESRVRRFGRNEVVIRERIGNNPRVFEFPDGIRFETDDNETVDKYFARKSGLYLVHVFEHHWQAVLLATACLVAFAVFSYYIVLPQVARKVAYKLDRDALEWTADYAWSLMEKQSSESELSDENRMRIQQQFDVLKKTFPEYKLRLELRREISGTKLNAFALPDGRIIFTDKMVEILTDSDEILAVMMHEMGHVIYRHGLQNAIQSLAISGFFMVVAGGADWSALAGMLVAQSYNRDHEREADYFAANQFLKMERDPAKLGEALQRMQRELDSIGEKLPSFLSSHPITDERVKYLKAYGKK